MDMSEEMKRIILQISVILVLALGVVASGNAQTATLAEAEIVAKNWIGFISKRDGSWGGSKAPSVKYVQEFKRGTMKLGYFAAVKPHGFIIISSIKDFMPIKAYSATDDMVPSSEIGMCALLKDVLENRIKFLVHRFGGIKPSNLRNLHKFTPERNRSMWSALSADGSATQSESIGIAPKGSGKVGPLLKTNWHQMPPYNNDCPDQGCLWSSHFNSNALVGCVPLAMAQIMRFFSWPPSFNDHYYDWPNMLNEYTYSSYFNWFYDETGRLVTLHQIDEVAQLCSDAGSVLHIDYGCDSTTAPMCDFWVADARDGFEDHFHYSSPDEDEPVCEEADSYGKDEWYAMICHEIDRNRPMLFRIANDSENFDHVVVVDGYDSVNLVHVNYGWADAHTAWYKFDDFDCDSAAGFQDGCEWTKYEMIRYIYPRGGIYGTFNGVFSPKNDPGDFPQYIYGDLSSSGLTVQGGAWVQFLPGVVMSCSANTIEIDGRDKTTGDTRFFSNGDPTIGFGVGGNGKIKMYANGAMRVY